MPLFIVAAIWLLCIVIGIGFLFLSKTRYLSAYLLLGSTFGMVASFALFMFQMTYVDKHITNSVLSLCGYLISPFIGAALGTPVGLFAAFRLNGIITRLRNSN